MKGINDINFRLFTSKVTVIIVSVLFFSVLGSTYAYFAYSGSDDSTITGRAATVDLTLDVSRVFPTEATNGKLVPQLSESGNQNSPLSTALKSACIDANGNSVCQVYSITIKNDGGTATEVVDGQISFYADSDMTVNSYTTMPNLKWKRITSVDTTTPNNSVLGSNVDKIASSTPEKFITDLILETNDEYTYYIIIWFNETRAEQVDHGNIFYGKIEFLSSNGTGVTSAFT